MFEDMIVPVEKEDVVNKIQYAYDQIYSIWNDVKFDEARKIRDAWNDEAGRIFIDKLLETDFQVNKILTELETLKDNWNKYLNKIEEE